MYCKNNVRRVINYTQTEPINKYDLWLSENARYNEDGELEYDNDGQPACDLILKLFRHGRWEPIVGYNTTTINNVSEQEWLTLFNSSSFYNAWNSPDNLNLELWLATTERIGGIKADKFVVGGITEADKFHEVECKFYPNESIYSQKQERLCVDAYDIKQALNDIDRDLYNEDPTSELIINGWKGVQTEMRENHNGIWVKANIESVELGNPPTSLSITNSNVSGQENSIIITGDNNYEKIVGPYEMFDNSLTSTSYSIDISMSLSQNTNPIYLNVNASAITLSAGTKYICDEDLLSNRTTEKGEFLITIQFGIVKIEKINN